MNEEEKTYKNLISDLKNLPKVDAPKNFETELLRKINSSAEVEKENFWSKLFSPGKLAPAAVAIATTMIVFFVVDINSEKIEDPLNIEPRLRDDLVVLETIDEISEELQENSFRMKNESKRNSDTKELLKEKENSTSFKKSDNDGLIIEQKKESNKILVVEDFELEANESDSFGSDKRQPLGGTVAPSTINTVTSEISRDNLNFMQRNLSSEEKVEVQQLKMRVQAEKSAKNEQKSTKEP